MEIERKALYNLLRMNWLQDPTTDVEPWQVENYRNLTTERLFHNLSERGIPLNETTFINAAEQLDSPEDLAYTLLEDSDLDTKKKDFLYLHLFELWRRLVPEKQSLSVFCDELDHQIFLYDSGDPSSAESIQDAIANLQMILDENFDQGVNPSTIFGMICASCANDLENFLYDFTAEQIDNDNIMYASELLDGFEDYLKGSKWIELLKLRLAEKTDPKSIEEPLRKMILKAARDNDLQFNLEILSLIVLAGERSQFTKIVKATAPLLESEEDFQDLLAICGDFYHRLDEDSKEEAIQMILNERVNHSLGDPIESNDPDISSLLIVIK